jgi:hypothetical protein
MNKTSLSVSFRLEFLPDEDTVAVYNNPLAAITLWSISQHSGNVRQHR